MKSHYKKFALLLSINAVIMFLLTYALIDTANHFYANLNRAYMAILMVCPMAIMMLIFMRGMYQNKKLNRILYSLFSLLFIGTFILARSQTGIGNQTFLRSMIPHHSSAILMCERASVTDPEIERLCRQIIDSQKREIAQMKSILKRY